MADFIDDMNRVLKYGTEQERQSFEAAIDANPLDSTTHLVYSDWLRERGHEEEADFRKAMGEWVNDGHLTFHVESYRPVEVRRKAGIVKNEPLVLPKGVGLSDIDLGEFGDQSTHLPRINSVTGTLNATTYRNLESAFRKAFQAGRQSTSS